MQGAGGAMSMVGVSTGSALRELRATSAHQGNSERARSLVSINLFILFVILIKFNQSLYRHL